MKTLLQSLKHYLWQYRNRYLLGILFITISNLFSIYPAQIVREAVDLVGEMLQTYHTAEGFQLQRLMEQEIGWLLLVFGGLVLLSAALRGFFLFLVRQTVIVASRKIEYDQKNVLFNHYQTYSLRVMRQNRTGDLMARIAEDVGHVRMFTGPGIMYTFNTASLFIMVLVTMLMVNAELTLYVLTPLPVLSLLIYVVHNYIIKRSEEKQAQLSNLSQYTQETYSGIRLLRAYARENRFRDDFLEESESFRDKSLRLVKVDAFFFPLMILLIGLSTIFTVWIGSQKVMAGTLSIGNIAEFVIYINLLVWPVTALGWVTSMINRAAASQRRINELMAQTSELEFPRSSPAIQCGSITYDRVTMRYPETGITALRDVSFELQGGQTLGIIGLTGSGKTSLANLLVRLMDPDRGEIRIDGRPLPQYSQAALRGAIGFVPQDGFLFSDTIANNIAFGRLDASQAEIEQAARFASIHEEILTLQHGYETMVGERGVTLSGGQKQRVAIARAFLMQPRIVLLDDALSAVDTQTEDFILDNIRHHTATNGLPPTMVIIAHRISTVQEADQIIVLDEGRIVEHGTHAELMKQDGRYARMYEQQRLESEISLEE